MDKSSSSASLVLGISLSIWSMVLISGFTRSFNIHSIKPADPPISASLFCGVSKGARPTISPTSGRLANKLGTSLNGIIPSAFSLSSFPTSFISPKCSLEIVLLSSWASNKPLLFFFFISKYFNFFSLKSNLFLSSKTCLENISCVSDITQATILSSLQHQVVIEYFGPDLFSSHGPPCQECMPEPILLV